MKISTGLFRLQLFLVAETIHFLARRREPPMEIDKKIFKGSERAKPITQKDIDEWENPKPVHAPIHEIKADDGEIHLIALYTGIEILDQHLEEARLPNGMKDLGLVQILPEKPGYGQLKVLIENDNEFRVGKIEFLLRLKDARGKVLFTRMFEKDANLGPGGSMEVRFEIRLQPNTQVVEIFPIHATRLLEDDEEENQEIE
jgi:hypothetical protein